MHNAALEHTTHVRTHDEQQRPGDPSIARKAPESLSAAVSQILPIDSSDLKVAGVISSPLRRHLWSPTIRHFIKQATNVRLRSYINYLSCDSRVVPSIQKVALVRFFTGGQGRGLWEAIASCTADESVERPLGPRNCYLTPRSTCSVQSLARLNGQVVLYEGQVCKMDGGPGCEVDRDAPRVNQTRGYVRDCANADQSRCPDTPRMCECSL
ncbi:hypothetical protein Bbelb_344770 [Branchiostoma belcheri]|nr:hypothetical protein Bbelb_344770 [Branchiostoma belcheri]